MDEREKIFEGFIESYLISEEGGWAKATDAGLRSEESRGMNLDIATLTDFVKNTQPMAWRRFERMCTINPVRQFYKSFENAVTQDGLISVLRYGFKHRGINFRVCYFKPESELNDLAVENYKKNVCQCIRQWHYSEQNTNSIDMLLALNGIPVVAIELKNQLTGQSVDDAKKQWAYNRNPKEPVFGFNKRILAYFACDLYDVYMTTRLDGPMTNFLPFNQGSNGAGRDGGAGNPPNPTGGYVTSYFWENVLQKDNLMDILQKFISYEKTEKKEVMPDGSTNIKKTEKIIFPRYHQLDVVRELVRHVRENGPGHNYLIQHSAGSGKSNSIAWTAYRKFKRAYTFATVKNDTPRIIYPAKAVIKMMKRLHDDEPNNSFVFCGLGDSPYLTYSMVRRPFEKIMKQIGMPEFRFHDLRHTYAVISIKAGVDLKTLSAAMGHHSVAFTLDTYAFALTDMKLESAKRMQSFLNEQKIKV